MPNEGIAPSRAAMGKAFQSLPREHGFEKLAVEGSIPKELRGTLYKNGPMVFECHGTPYRHWLDGDGGIVAVRFDGGHAEGAVRVTATKHLVEERKAGKMLYGSGFTQGPLWHKRLFAQSKNPMNVHVLVWQARLYAMADMGTPYEIDRETLETKGPSNWDGAIRQVVNAHVRVHPRTGSIYAFGPTMGMKSALDVIELPRSGAAKRIATIPMRSPPMLIHDFALSDKHLIFVKPPVSVKIGGLMLGMGTPMDAISYHADQPTEVIVVPLAEPEKVIRIDLPSFFHFHDANAFEIGPRALAVDLCKYKAFDLGDAFMLDSLRTGEAWNRTPTATLERLHIDLDKREGRLETVWDKNCDFPTTSPARQGQRARYLWSSVTRGQVDRVTKLDWETGDEIEADLPAHEITGEPTFVPRPGASEEDDGWLLNVAFDAKAERSFVAIMDAKDPRELLAKVRFDHHCAFPLHGVFVAQ